MEKVRLLLPSLESTNTLDYETEFTEESIASPESHSTKRKKQSLIYWISYACIGLGTVALGFVCGILVARRQSHHGIRLTEPSMKNTTTCASPPTRREWRSLSVVEKDKYIDAVICLKGKPSRLGNDHSLYDDFPYVHNQFDKDIHFAASFLPWHRYFIYTYHHALVDECGYDGELPYWDWTLDWQAFPDAPVWDLAHGFSGNGVPTSEPSTFFPRAHCVSEGRFANFEVIYAKSASSPHCLTRDFGSGEPLDELMQNIRPSALEKIRREEDYYRFLIRLEARAHLSIPKAIMGDFGLFTAPNDPIFFLHHAQIDRLWWLWEQYDLPRRRNAYSGSFKAKSEQQASPDDMISLGFLAPTIKVKDILDIQSPSLCYIY